MKTKTLAALAGLCIAAPALAQTSFTNSTGLVIPDANTTGVTQTVSSNLSGLVTQIQVNLNLTHSWVGDLIVRLSYNDGNSTQTADLISRVGRSTSSLAPTVTGSPFGSSRALAGSYNFGDQFSATMWGGTGTMPTNVFTPNAFDAGPGNGYRATTNSAAVQPAGGTVVNLNAIFGGMGATGTWTLFVADYGGGDTGAVASWSVTILPTPGAAALLGLGGLAAARRRRA